jgi:hypothetical protein
MEKVCRRGCDDLSGRNRQTCREYCHGLLSICPKGNRQCLKKRRLISEEFINFSKKLVQKNRKSLDASRALAASIGRTPEFPEVFTGAPRLPSKISSSRHKFEKGSSEYLRRVDEPLEINRIKWARWAWRESHPVAFKKMLKSLGWESKDIDDMISGIKPLDFKTRKDYRDFVADVNLARDIIIRRYGLEDLTIIQQGSSVAGYSSNPTKGGLWKDGVFNPDAPNYIYDPSKGSDTDLRVASSSGLDKVVQLRLAEGYDLHFKSGASRQDLLAPKDAGILFPEFKPLMAKWEPYFGQLQITIKISPITPDFLPMPWDKEIEHRKLKRSRYFYTVDRKSNV